MIHFEIPSHFIYIGSTMTGKSHLAMYIMYLLRNEFDYGVCISGSSEVEPISWVSPRYQYSEFSPELMETIMNKQKNYIKTMGKKNAPQCFVHLDDIAGIINHMGMKYLEMLFSKARHWNISMFALVQNMTMVSPTIRANTRYYFCTLTSGKSIEHLYEPCSRGFNNKAHFKKYLDETCVGWQTAVFDTHSRNKVEDCRGIISAPEHIRFMFKPMKRFRNDIPEEDEEEEKEEEV